MPRYKLRTLLIVIALGPIVDGCVHVISREEATLSAIVETQVRIHLFMLANRDVPQDLSVLPKREGYANQTTDGWQRPLIYLVDDSGVISLSSFGRDGKPGGTGVDADMVRRYRTRDESGQLNIDDDLWIVNSEIRDHAADP